MAKYQDYTQYVDSYLAKLSPSQMAVINDWLNHPNLLAGAESQQANAAARVLANQLGLEPTAAGNLLQLVAKVRKQGTQDVDPGAFKDTIGTRAEYASDDEFLNAYLKAQGLEADPTRASQTPGGQATTENTDDVTARINSFMAGLDPNSDSTKRMQALIARRAQAQQGAASSRAGLGSVGSGGMGGGLSEMGRASIAGDLNAKYDLQRQGLQSQALGLLNQRDLGLKGLEQGYLQMQNQQAEAQWAAQKNQAQGLGSAIGAGVGALGFIGGPALGAATMGAGSALGGGLGGLAGGGSAPKYASIPSWAGGGKKSGSFGGTGY